MGWFGGSSSTGSGDTSMSSGASSSGLDLSSYGSASGGDTFASKKRSPSSYDLDDSAGGSFSPGLSPGADIQQQVQLEQQKLQMLTAIHKVNDMCWETCIDSVGSSLSGKQETCLKNCTGRFIDSTLFLTNRMAQLTQRMQQKGGRR